MNVDAYEVKAQLSYLRRLLSETDADTLHNRRTYNRLLRQYRALLRGGAKTADPSTDPPDKLEDLSSDPSNPTLEDVLDPVKINDDQTDVYMYYAGGSGYQKDKSSPDVDKDENTLINKFYRPFLRSNKTLLFTKVVFQDGTSKYIWRKWDSDKRKFVLLSQDAEAAAAITLERPDPAAAHSKDPGVIEITPAKPAAKKSTPPKEVVIELERPKPASP